jgi:DNA-binding MarR family transcriptional regulator
MHGAAVADKSAQIAAIEGAVVDLRRAQKRRALARMSRRTGEHASALPDAVFELLDVLAAAEQSRTTVTEVAAVLDVDQPRASRLVAQALAAGLIRRAADQRDGRRSLLVLTSAGEDAIAGIHDFRRRVIAEATTGWSDNDRASLARLLPRFVRDFSAVTEATGRR